MSAKEPTPTETTAELARIQHGRHCPCSACQREDWTNPNLAPCGMHGASCPEPARSMQGAGAGIRYDAEPARSKEPTNAE